MPRKATVDPHQALKIYRECSNLKETASVLGKTKSAVWRALQKLSAGRKLCSERARNREQSDRRQKRLAAGHH